MTAIKYWKQLLIEAYIGFLCWSTSYLFIRRMCNPENHGQSPFILSNALKSWPVSTYTLQSNQSNPTSNLSSFLFSGEVYKKFAADAFYGGGAAFATVLLKPLLSKALQT